MTNETTKSSPPEYGGATGSVPPFTRRWPDGTPRFDRAGEPFRTKALRASAKALDVVLCHYYDLAPNAQVDFQKGARSAE